MTIRSLIFATALAAAFALPASAGKGPDQPLSPQDAKGWVGKPVYSNDGKELGKVMRLDSRAENKATQLYTDIGSTTGSDKHQVILPATRFSLESDRIVIDMTAAQASKLPNMNHVKPWPYAAARDRSGTCALRAVHADTPGWLVEIRQPLRELGRKTLT